MAITTVTLQPDGSLVTATEPDDTAASAPVGETTADLSAPAPDDTTAAPAPEEGEATAAPAPAREDEPTGDEGEEPSDHRRQPSSYDRRFARERRAKEEALQRAAAAEERARLYEAGRVLPPEPASAPPTPGPPQMHEFATDDEWRAAQVRYEVAQILEARDREAFEARARERYAAQERALADRQETFRRQHPDYDEVLERELSGRMSPALFMHLIEDDDGPALAYHVLARDRAELDRLNAMDDRALPRALGRLAARIPGHTNGSTPSPTPVTPKPAPLTPVSGAGAGAPQGYRADMSQGDFEKVFPYDPRRR